MSSVKCGNCSYSVETEDTAKKLIEALRKYCGENKVTYRDNSQM